MKSKKFLSSVTVLFFFILIFALSSNTLTAADGKEKYEEKFEKSVSIAKDGKVFVKNVSGDITVGTWNKGEVKIDALKISKADTASKAKENAGKVTIEVTEDDTGLRIETKYPKGVKKLNVSVTFNLMIPAQASPEVNTVSGDLALTKIGGAAKAITVSGEVTIEDVLGALKAKSVSGDVVVTNAGKGVKCDSVSGNVEARNVKGDAYLKSVSGNIIAEKIQGAIDADTVSGGVKMVDVSNAKTIKAKALSGTVKYSGEIYPDGTYSFQSHSGNVNVTIPAGSAFDLEAQTFSGSVDTDFEITISGKIGRKSLKGSINGGGADVTLKTFSGNISLKKK